MRQKKTLVIAKTGKTHQTKPITVDVKAPVWPFFFPITSAGIALLSLTEPISPARQGLAFPLHDGRACPE